MKKIFIFLGLLWIQLFFVVSQASAASTTSCTCKDAKTLECVQTGVNLGNNKIFTETKTETCAVTCVNTPPKIRGTTENPISGAYCSEVKKKSTNCACFNEFSKTNNQYACNGGDKLGGACPANQACVAGGSFDDTKANQIAEGISCKDTEFRGNTMYYGCRCTGENSFSCPDPNNPANKVNDTCGAGDSCSNDATGAFGKDKASYHEIICSKPMGLNCKCETKNLKGKSKFTCDYKGQKASAYCVSGSDACFDDDRELVLRTHSKKDANPALPDDVDAKGILCAAVQPTSTPPPATLPPPPSPPCVRFGGEGRCEAVTTGIGNVDTDPGLFVSRMFSLLMALMGGIGILLLMRAGYRIMNSQGKPEAIQEGREQFIAVVIGLLFILLSFVLLELITVDILHIDTIK